MTTAAIETHPEVNQATNTIETTETTSQAPETAAVTHESNWWWDYAAMKAPDHNEMYYFKFTLLSITFFFACHLTVHLICKKTQVYKNCDYQKQAYFRTTVVSIFHSLICVVLCTIALFYICGNGQTVFNSAECIETVRYIHIWSLITTCGFFIVDLFFIVAIIQGRTTLDY